MICCVSYLTCDTVFSKTVSVQRMQDETPLGDKAEINLSQMLQHCIKFTVDNKPVGPDPPTEGCIMV